MRSLRRTLPARATRPRSFRPRSTSITCSERSFGSASSSLRDGARPPRRSRPRGRVPAIGRTCTTPSSTRTSVSGLAPAIVDLGEAEEVHVRRRVEHAHRAVDIERIGRARGRTEALRENDLEDVARADVLLGALDGGAKPGLVEARCGERAVVLGIGRREVGEASRSAELLLGAVEPFDGALVRVARVEAVAGAGEHDEPERLAARVEDDQRATEREREVEVSIRPGTRGSGAPTVGSKRRTASYDT